MSVLDELCPTLFLRRVHPLNGVQAKYLKEHNEPFKFHLFFFDGTEYKYKYANFKPWNPEVEVREYEYGGMISSITKLPGE